MKVIKKLDFSVKHIVHIADIHIRNVKRHDEYQLVFDRMYDKIRQLKEDHRDLVIYLGGDIVHNKLDMSPELVSITYKLLKSCADIAPTFLILGNHDCNLNNKSRLDALSPIVESLNHDNLIFCRETGIYKTNNVDFVVWSIIDDLKNYTIPKKNTNKQILFYHGAVDNAVTEHGMIIKNDKVKLDSISAFDYALLGDIHKQQYLNEKKTFAYCGSTVQQNFGESLFHGFLFWNIETGFSKFVEVENESAFYTLEVRNGKWVHGTFPDSFCDKPHIRIKSYDTDQTDITKLVTALKSSVKVEDIKIQKINTKPDIVVNRVIKTGDVRDIEYQNKLITSFLEKNSVLSDSIKQEIYSINRQLNTNIDISKTIKNITWVPIQFKFSNMFSYGEDNEILFDNMEGIYGLFASNAAGKSSILDALMFCMFDKCSRTFKASEVLNNNKEAFTCRFVFEIHGKRYVIDRVGIKDKKQHVKVNVDFYTFDNFGHEIMLNGDDRDETNRIIREYIGNYDEFILTTMSLQNNNSNFVDKAQRERKDLLSQFLDLNVFEELTQLATTEANQLKALIKDYNKQDFSTQIANAVENKKIVTEQAAEYTVQKNNINQEINKINDEILLLTTTLKPIDESILTLNLTQLNANKTEFDKKIKACQEKYAELTITKKNLETEYKKIKKQIVDDESEQLLLSNKNKEDELLEQRSNLNVQLEKLEITISHLQSSIEKLKTHEYDPDCKYCINNEFVKEAYSATNQLKIIINKKNELLRNLDNINLNIIKYQDASIKYYEYLNLKSNVNDLKSKLIENDNKFKDLELIQNKINAELDDIRINTQKYNENKEAIEENNRVKEKIKQFTENKNILNKQLSSIENAFINASSQIKVYESVIKSAKTNIQKMESLQIQYKSYELYIKATNRNGVPYDLISEILPQIENEANEILSYLVDFKIILDTDGKSINIYIMYDESRIWALELASGMEKFISSIAIRNALINYSNLPRPNFIAIDEGFGVLDSENINALYNVFQYLKTQYKFILIISHIDSLKDMAEHQIEIYKNGQFSKVIF